MKDYRFYLEYASATDKRKGTRKTLGLHTGNVVAVDTSLRPYYSRGSGAMVECFSGVYGEANSPACWTAASTDYLREKCRHISEAQAREIHPALFQRMGN